MAQDTTLLKIFMRAEGVRIGNLDFNEYYRKQPEIQMVWVWRKETEPLGGIQPYRISTGYK